MTPVRAVASDSRVPSGWHGARYDAITAARNAQPWESSACSTDADSAYIANKDLYETKRPKRPPAPYAQQPAGSARLLRRLMRAFLAKLGTFPVKINIVGERGHGSGAWRRQLFLVIARDPDAIATQGLRRSASADELEPKPAIAHDVRGLCNSDPPAGEVSNGPARRASEGRLMPRR